MSHKEVWIAKYEELAQERYGCEYWELTKEQENELCRLADAAATDYFADLGDRLKDEAKYKGMQ